MDFAESHTIPPTLPPSPPQFYATVDLAKEALQESAKEKGFTLVTRRSNPRRIDLSCSLWPQPTRRDPLVSSKAKSREVIKIRTNCPYIIYIY